MKKNVGGAAEVELAEVGQPARMAGPSAKSRGNVSRFAGGYRPGMYGGYRPSWSRFGGGAGLGASDWKLGEFLKMPQSLRTTAKDLLVGGLVGTVANRVVTWVAPGLVKTDSRLAAEAIGFAVGIVPYLVKQNPMTVGVALPGLFFLAGALTEYAIGKSNLLGAKPALSGGALMGRSSSDPVLAAREKLAAVHNRIAAARQQAGIPRIQASRVA